MARLHLCLVVALGSCRPAPPAPPVCPEPSVQPPTGDPVETVRQYLYATAAGDLDRAAALVREDSVVFESGGNEGTWAHYREHHLGPELELFAKFELRPDDARTSTSADGTLALVTLPMEYDITLKDERKIESVGTVTFALKHDDGKYLIEHIHWSSRRKRRPQPKPDLLATEKAAYEKARPVFEQHCASCHLKGEPKAKKKSLGHFDMSTYPFGGHHADEIAGSIRKVLGAAGKKPTMPKGNAGAVKGEELELILAWAEAFTKADAAGLHEKPAKGHDDGHSHKHCLQTGRPRPPKQTREIGWGAASRPRIGRDWCSSVGRISALSHRVARRVLGQPVAAGTAVCTTYHRSSQAFRDVGDPRRRRPRPADAGCRDTPCAKAVNRRRSSTTARSDREERRAAAQIGMAKSSPATSRARNSGSTTV